MERKPEDTQIHSELGANGVEASEEAPDVEPGIGSDLETIQLLTAERDNYLDQLQRSLAEFANYRKRVEQDRINARRIATSDLLASIVPIADDFHRALAAIPEDQRDVPWVAGVTLIDRNLANLLEREGVTQIESLGQAFDPSVHEAISVVPDSDASTVVEVYQNGYRHGNTLLKPAIVRVGDAIEPDEEL